MALSLQRYRQPADYWRARALFRDLGELGDRQAGRWHVGEFDYWRWHWLENVVERSPEELCFWQTEAGRVVAVLSQGDPGVCHLHVHPDFRTPSQLTAMVLTAEQAYGAAVGGAAKRVWVWATEGDRPIHDVLEQRAFQRQQGTDHSVEHRGRVPLTGAPADPAPLPPGFVVRSMREADDLPARSLASWRAFHPGEPDDGCDPTGAWYRNVQRAPLYRCDLDVIAVAPNGDIASFATCYFDDVSRTGVFVLDGTAPPYRRLGLGRAVMTEALRRLQWLGAVAADVSWYDAAAGALYAAVGFEERWRGHVHVKAV